MPAIHTLAEYRCQRCKRPTEVDWPHEDPPAQITCDCGGIASLEHTTTRQVDDTEFEGAPI